MPAPVIPTKTALGQEELRRRTGGIGPRHRTILFLIDGRRPLSEVLSLAQKAGAATSHFEDLVRLGYVEMPPEEFAPTVPEAALPAETPAEVAELTHVELTVPADQPDDDAVPPPVPEPVSETVVVAAPPAPPVPPVLAPAPPAVRAPAPPVEPPPLPARSPVAQAVEELVDVNEPLGRIKRSLLDALHMDPTPFGFRAAMRVRTARTTAALVEIVWEMERDMSHSMRSRSGLQNLQRARELLGLGNTLVDEDSQSARPDDSTW